MLRLDLVNIVDMGIPDWQIGTYTSNSLHKSYFGSVRVCETSLSEVILPHTTA